jgi:hypothetical protein
MTAQTETVVFYLASDAGSSEAEGNAISLLKTSYRVIVVPMGSPDRDTGFPGAWATSAMSRSLVPAPTRALPMIHHD